MEITPLISVIITAYNRPEYLAKTIESIVNQTYENIEVLVIDDGSKLENARKIKKLAESFQKCTYYHKENSGQPDSRNYGIKRAKGIYIAFCDDDDFWALNKLERQVKFLEENKEYGVVGGCVEYINEKGIMLGVKKCKENYGDNIFIKCLEKNQINSPTPLIRNTVFKKVGLFNPSFTIAEDWEFWRRVSYFYKIHNFNETLAYLRMHEHNMSKTRTSNPLEHFLLYRKLTISLIRWGKPFFNRSDMSIIQKKEWQTFRKTFTNRCPGILKKIKLLLKIVGNRPSNASYLLYLFFRFGIKS